METTTGIRELKARLSAYLRQVRAGETVVVTDHGEPVARIVPIERAVADRVRDVADAGLVEWDGGRLASVEPPARARGSRTVADLLLGDRA